MANYNARPAGSLLIYGESGTGKTLDAAHAFRQSAYILTEPGGLTSVESCLGPEFLPKHVLEVFDLAKPVVEFDRQVKRALELFRQGQLGPIPAVVLDTASELSVKIIAAAGVKEYKTAYSVVEQTIMHAIRQFLALGREGLWFVCLCHEDPPGVDEQTRRPYRGRPLFAGRKFPPRVPPLFDVILRAQLDPAHANSLGDLTPPGATPASPPPNPRVYYCDSTNGDWVTKDRMGLMPEPFQPMELLPLILRYLYPGREIPEEFKRKPIRRR